MNFQRLTSAIATAAILSTGSISLSMMSAFSPLTQSAKAVSCNWSSARPLPWNVNVREGKTSASAKIGVKPAGAILNFEAWEDGQSVPDAWSGQLDSKWFKLRGERGWVASAVIPGYPPNCSRGTGLHSNPTPSNPLTGFKHPLNNGNLDYGTHWSSKFGQAYARDFSANFGTAVYAMRSGTVIGWRDSTADKARGNAIDDGLQGTTANYLLIKLDDSDGVDDNYRMMYLHLKQGSIPAALKQIGARVQSGQQVGSIGYNGASDGVHLHVEVNKSTGSTIWSRETKPFRS